MRHYPLVHFLISGILLFAGYEWLNRGASTPAAERPITASPVTRDRIAETGSDGTRNGTPLDRG
jgi:hypothetical protein